MSQSTVAVLVSGGLDSAILIGHGLKYNASVVPIYVRFGLAWETVEKSYLEKYLDALKCPALMPLVELEQPVADIYGDHWSVTAEDVPDAKSPDEAVFLPGRNVLLLAKPLLWCHLNEVPALALGVLQTNPFPDATYAFFDAMQSAVNLAMKSKVDVEMLLPFASMKKTQVMHIGRDLRLPLKHTFSCIAPVDGIHCGACNKCAERQHAFDDGEMRDPTQYASEPEA